MFVFESTLSLSEQDKTYMMIGCGVILWQRLQLGIIFFSLEYRWLELTAIKSTDHF